MEPYSKYVVQSGIDEIADFFSSQKKLAPAIMKVNAKTLSRGATLASQCIACHGPKGDGDNDRMMPSLRGQPAGYLLGQMALFASDKRKIEPVESEEAKKRSFKGLVEDDLTDLAAYYATLK